MKVKNGERCTFCNAHNENIPHLFWRCNIVQNCWSLFETSVSEKCINVTNMKPKEDFVAFGNAKD